MGVAAKTLGFLKIRAQGLQILTGPYFFFVKLWSGGKIRNNLWPKMQLCNNPFPDPVSAVEVDMERWHAGTSDLPVLRSLPENDSHNL